MDVLRDGRIAAVRSRARLAGCRLPSDLVAAFTKGRAMSKTRVHALMAPVAQPIAANVAAALGIDISMTDDPEEVGRMAAVSDAVLINLGMANAERRAGAVAAADAGRPFILDPVKVDRSPERLAFARRLVERAPLIVKGNRAEMAALGPLPEGTVAVTTGAHDTVADAQGQLTLLNGSPLLDRVIATGCAAGVVMAARAAQLSDPFAAAAVSLSELNVAAELAAGRGPESAAGTFAVHWIDALAALDPRDLAARIALARPPLDLSVYLVMGPEVEDPVTLAREAVAGGVTLIQWRDKASPTRPQVDAVQDVAGAVDVPVLVNDRADVAFAADAAGVHLGHGDLTPAQARAILAHRGMLGVTVHSLQEAEGFASDVFDYASVGGVFETRSKQNPNPPIGIDGFAAIAGRLRRDHPGMPVCAIAGIDPERAAKVCANGADGVAVMSAITKADDPRRAAGALREAVERGRARR